MTNRQTESPMQISCPDCGTSYEISRTSLGTDGRKVRCIRCERIWFAAPPPDMTDLIAAVEAIGLTPRQEPEIAPPAESGFDPGATDDASQDDAERRSTEASGPQVEFSEEHGAPRAVPQDLDAMSAASGKQATEPVSIEGAPSIVPADEHGRPLAAITEPLEPDGPRNVRTFFSQRAQSILARKRKTSRIPSRALLVLVLAAAVAGLFVGRMQVVRLAPQTASLYAFLGMPVNLRGLTFANVRTARETHDGVPVLIVEGDIVSISANQVEVPRLRFAARNAKGQEIYSWTALPTRSTLPAGGTLGFSSRLASPPPDASDVMVRFFNRRDIVATIR